jgi:hypothetical protein
MTYGTPTTPADVLALIAAKLRQALGLSANLVFVSLSPDDWHLRFPPADRFCTLRPASGRADQRDVAGGGRGNTCLPSVLRAAVFQRLDRDREGRADKGLSDPSASLLGDAVRVIDALQMLAPVSPDAPDACLLREPMRVQGYQVVPKTAQGGDPWAVAETTWEYDFRLKLS